MGNSFNHIFRNLSENLYCPSCGNRYNGSEINSVIKNEQGYLVSVNCHKCKLTVMVNVVTNKPFKPADSLPRDEAAIEVDDILDFYNELKYFDGDFSKAFHKN